MSRSQQLEDRLKEWAEKYGGSKYENVGWQGISPIANLMKYHGRPPQGLNPGRVETNGAADEVEGAVRALQVQKGGEVLAAVLRCHYFAHGVDRPGQLRRLAKVGHRMATSRFSHHLRAARIHVAAWLHIPFDEPLEDAEAIEMLEQHLAVTG